MHSRVERIRGQGTAGLPTRLRLFRQDSLCALFFRPHSGPLSVGRLPEGLAAKFRAGRSPFLSQRERVRVREKTSDVLRRANTIGVSSLSPSPQSSPAGRGGQPLPQVLLTSSLLNTTGTRRGLRARMNSANPPRSIGKADSYRKTIAWVRPEVAVNQSSGQASVPAVEPGLPAWRPRPALSAALELSAVGPSSQRYFRAAGMHALYVRPGGLTLH